MFTIVHFLRIQTHPNGPSLLWLVMSGLCNRSQDLIDETEVYPRTPRRKQHRLWMSLLQPYNKNVHSRQLVSTIPTQRGEISLVSAISIQKQRPKVKKKNTVKRGAVSSRRCLGSSRECNYSPRQCSNHYLTPVQHLRSRSSRNLYEAHSAC